jgi:glycosyltransferase involved in cell wall biosynthesis
MYKLLILQPYEDNGCGFYRTKQFALLAKQNELDAQYIDMSLSEEGLYQAIETADAYLLRLSDLVAIEVFEQFEWDKIKKPIFLDIDDNYESIDPLSDLYRAYGTQDVQLKDGTFLWKDGVNLDIQKNKKRLERYQMIMRKCTAIFVTTFELKSYAEKYNKTVIIIPNSINFDIFPKVKDVNKARNEIRLLWSGGSTHFPDLLEIRESLENLMRKNLNLHLYILGVPFNGIIKNMPKDRVHPMGWVKPDGHGYRLACMDADIAICPLKDFPFNYYKSSVKYYETSALRVPNVAKNMPPYKDDIIDGVNGLLYSNPQEFQEKVQLLIDDPIKRIEIGNAGFNYVKRNRKIEDIARDWAEVIKGIIGAIHAK